MTNVRQYGAAPYAVVVVHGGPGAPGEMAPVARRLAGVCGVLEPLQTAFSVQGQIQELVKTVSDHAHVPVTLIGYSWGAWLSYMTAATRRDLVKKLILVAAGPFEESDVPSILATRLNRLNPTERTRTESLLRQLAQEGRGSDNELAELGALMSIADTYQAAAEDADGTGGFGCQADMFRIVWAEAAELRRSGRLLAMGRQITCPVVAIHGDYDPHPADGVRGPLSRVLADFRFKLLTRCGHTPWREQNAAEPFYDLLVTEITRD